jgi:thiol-disulfide isomerase/thioredoxin
MAASYAGQLKNKPLSTVLLNIRNQKYPQGSWRRFEYYNRISMTKDTAEQWTIIREYKRAYADEGQEQSLLPLLTSIIQGNLIDLGDISGALALIPKDDGGLDRAAAYNNIAWGACEKNIDIPQALALSKASLDTLHALEVSGRGKPVNETMAQYQKLLLANYSLYADTYAYLLYKTGSYNEAFTYEQKALATAGPKPAVDIISRYHLFMEKVEKPSKVVASLSVYIAKGQSDSTMEAQFKRLYKGSQSPNDAYAGLEAQAKATKQAEMVKTIMNEPASRFTLVDLDGHKVSLDSLKGKTVVVDFWATWCGPCKASFPAMQKLVQRHKDDKNVAFLFVDTWETVDDKKQNAADFIKKSPYTFHVLLDNDSKVVADFKVGGIPTKFVIDRNGVTRFKAVGFNGSTEDTIDEMESMIAVAQKN